MSNGSTVKASPYGMQPAPGFTLTGTPRKRPLARSYSRSPKDLYIEFVHSTEDGRTEPRNKEEFNKWLKRQYPTSELRVKQGQFDIARSSYRGAVRRGQARQTAAAGKHLSTLKDTKRKYEVRLKKEASEAAKLGGKEYEAKILDLPEEEYTKYQKLPSAEKQKQRKTFIDGIKKRVYDEDSAYKDVTAEISQLKTMLTRPRPTRPQKERPSGGGTLTVEEDMPGGAKADTVITTKGEYRNAQQYKFEPTDDGYFKVYSRNTGDARKKGDTESMAPAWKPYPGGPVMGTEINEIFQKDMVKTTPNVEKPIEETAKESKEFESDFMDMPKPDVPYDIADQVPYGLAPSKMEPDPSIGSGMLPEDGVGQQVDTLGGALSEIGQKFKEPIKYISDAERRFREYMLSIRPNYEESPLPAMYPGEEDDYGEYGLY